MKYQLDSEKPLSLVDLMAQRSGQSIENGLFNLPETIGVGTIRNIQLGPEMKVVINRCTFNKPIKLEIQANKAKSNFLTFSFRNVFLPTDKEIDDDLSKRPLPSVQVSSWGMNIEINIPSNTKVSSILIHTHVDELKKLFNQKEGNFLIEKITSGKQPLLYEEIISNDIQKAAESIIKEIGQTELQDFYYKLKAQELIFLFFAELLKRKDVPNYPINIDDVKNLYKIREIIINDLTVAPKLNDLTKIASMSESKMNRLFKQVFGNTIYNYHQKLRMNEAAYLIKEKKYSVSTVGYQLGFSNLSHFSRIFERHIGQKPKKYSIL